MQIMAEYKIRWQRIEQRSIRMNAFNFNEWPTYERFMFYVMM